MSATLEGRRNYAEFDEYIDYQLQKTRQGVKLTDVVTAACGVALLTVSYLLAFVVLDHWVIEGGFGYGMRVALLSALLVAVLALIGWRVVLPWLRSVTRLYAAKSLEGIEPELSSNLLNYVDLRDSGREVSQTIIRSIEKRAAVTLSHTDVEDAVDRRMLLRISYGLLGAVVLFSLYTLVSPKKVWPSVVRVFAPWSDTSVSTQTEFLSIDPGQDVEVISGQSLEVSVGLRGEIPETVTLSYTTDDHSFVDETVDMYASEDGLKQFRCTLNGLNGDGLLQSLSYRITANDAVSRAYRVTVKQPPSASVTGIRYDFPDYMEFPAQSLAGPNIEAWEGTRITIEAKTNVPVKRARIEFSEEEQFGVHPVDMDMTVDENDPTLLSAVWQPIHHFQTNGVFPKFYRIQCRTPDGTENPSPAFHTIRIKADQKPDLVAIAPAEDREVPANAVIPFLAKASDPDFRLSQVVLKLQHGTRAPIEREVYSGTDDRTKSIYDLKLRDSGLILRDGDIVEWWLEARDNRFVEGPDPRNRNQNRVLLEANVAITPRLQLIIREPVDEQEAEEQHKFDREALEDKLDAANDQPNEGEPFSDDGNPPPPDERNFDPENPPKNSDPNNTEEQPAGDENSNDPQNGAEQSGDGGKTEGQSGEGTTDGGEGQSGTKPGKTGTEEGDTGTSESPDGAGGSNQQRPLSNTGEDDQEVLRELLQRQAQNDKGKPQPNAPPNPNDTGDPENNTSPDGDSGNPDGDPSGNNDDDSQKPGAEGAPNDPGKPAGNTPAGNDPEGNDPSNPDGTPTPNQEPNPDGSPAKPDGDSSESGTDPKNPAENSPPKGNAGSDPKPAETDPESGSGTSNEKPSTPNGDQPASEDGNAGNETQPGNEPPNSDGDAGQDSGPKASDKPGEPGQSPDGDPAQGNSGSDSPKDPQGNSPRNGESEKPGENGSTGSEPNDKPNGASEKGTEGQDGNSGNKPSQDGGSADQPGKSGDSPNGNKPEPGNSGKSGSKSESGDSGQSGKSGSKPESGSSESENSSNDKSGSGSSDSPSDKKPDGKSGEGGTSPSDANSKTGDENSKGSGESNSDSTQSGKTGENGSDPKSEGTPDGEGKPKDDGASPDTDSNSENGNKSSEESQSKSGKSGSSSKSESGQSGKSGKSGSSGKGGAGSGQNGEAGGSSASGSGNPTEGSQTGPPSKSKNPGEGERVVRDPAELDPANAAAAEGAGGSISDPNPGEADEAPLEDRLKATNMVLKKLKEDMKRGEVDDALLKKLGWTEKDMQRFVERMDRNLETPKPNDAREAARRRQFEESLKSLDLKSSGGERLDQMQNKRDTNSFSDRRLPVPRQYRKAYEDITRRLSRQKKGSGK